MGRVVYVNGEYLAEEDAKISVFDRGFLFADGVYEVSSVLDGKLVDNAAHLQRLERSLGELSLDFFRRCRAIHAQLTREDFDWLQRFGIFKQHLRYEHGYIRVGQDLRLAVSLAN